MKKIALLLAVMFSMNVNAQLIADYYEGKERIEVNGITFRVEYKKLNFNNVKSVVSLYNADNTRCDEVNFRYADGRMLQTEEEYAKIRVSANRGVIYKILREVLGDSKISALRAYKIAPLTLFFVVAPNGTTLEVSFIMDGVPPMLSIKPAQFAMMEKRLKSEVKWSVNDFGRQLQFMHATGEVNFKFVPLSSELITIKDNSIDNKIETGLVPVD